jgi:hypothetical protein
MHTIEAYGDINMFRNYSMGKEGRTYVNHKQVVSVEHFRILVNHSLARNTDGIGSDPMVGIKTALLGSQ